EAADAAGVDLYYEAAVAAAIPVVGMLRRSLAGDHIQRISGIVNGTTNFILDAMESTGATYDDALAEATRLGYAEADPTADVEGHDAASKAAIMASLGFYTRVNFEDVYCEGISNVTSEDIAAANQAGYTIKLLAICERLTREDGTEAVNARVHPTLVPKEHPLATVSESYNAIFVEAEAAGSLMFYGNGAGGYPTASAVVGDIVCAIRNVVYGGRAAVAYTYSIFHRVYDNLESIELPLYRVSDSYNAIFVEAEAAGSLMFYGNGAGGYPTASAVVGDIVGASRNIVYGGRAPEENTYANLPLADSGEALTCYHIDMQVDERTGVLAAISSEFSKQGVSLRTVRQEGSEEDARLIVVTHTARESALRKIVE